MRIIAGTHRGRRYLPPKDDPRNGKITRPITGRVKQSLFDRLWSMGVLPHEAGDDDEKPSGGNPGVRVLDLFCGTGSLGLEALSRGAGHCTFVDMDRDAVGRLERNLAELDLTDRARIVKASALNPIWLAQLKPESLGLIFLDPPYALAEDEQGRSDLARLMSDLTKSASSDCVLVCRTPRHVTPQTADGWTGPTSHSYGSMTLHFFERE